MLQLQRWLKSRSLSLSWRSNLLRSPSFHATRLSSSSSQGCFDLPPPGEWRDHFSSYHLVARDRISIRNPATASLLARSYFDDPNSIAAGENKIVIEAFPGPGQLSRALLQLPSSKLKKLIILEDYEPYLKYLRPLTADPRVTVVPLSGFDWDTYNVLEEQGILDDIESVSWDGGVHPQLHFISHIPHAIKGEQLVAQLFRCIPNHSWLFKYGRVPMSFIVAQKMWERVVSPAGSTIRCKVGVIAEASAELQYSVRPSLLLPYENHFHPVMPSGSQSKRPESRRHGNPLVSANIVPHREQVIEGPLLDMWDFVLRRLFVLRNTSLKSSIGCLAPGAGILLQTLTSDALPPSQCIDINKKIRDLTIPEWALIIRAFHDWPFAPPPEDLAISGTFHPEKRRG